MDYLKNQTVDLIICDQANIDLTKTSQEYLVRRMIHDTYYTNVDNQLYLRELEPEMFTASKYINKELLERDNVKGVFIPPTYAEISPRIPIGLLSNRFLITSVLTDTKRVDMAIKAFSRVPELELHIYGGDHMSIMKLKESVDVPSNVVFKGFVHSSNIPRHIYAGYVSCSKKEMYANAMVESMGIGLLPILSDVDYAHSVALQNIDEPFGFTNEDELVKVLEYVRDMSPYERYRVSKKVLDYADKTFSYKIAKEETRKGIEEVIWQES